MRSLISRIESAPDRAGGTLTFMVGDEPQPVTWAELHDDARTLAAVLQARGVTPGDHVALLGPTTRPLVAAIQAVWLTGGTLVVLPLPMRMGSLDEFVAQTRRRIANADATLVIVDDDLAPFLDPQAGDAPTVLMSTLAADAARRSAERYERPADDLDALAILQFTSGSTADPKGVMLPGRTLGANLDALSQAAALDPDVDVLVSWLPLYHDMGLVGLLTTPMTTGADLVLGAPQDFMARPGRWMEWISAYGGTATAGPNFSWVLATRALQRSEPLDLSSLRVALNGAEPVDPDTVEDFVAAAEPHGLDPGAVFPAFGMAELAIAGTFPEPMAGLRTDVVDRRVLETERYAAPVEVGAEGSSRLAKLGRPVPGLEIRIVDPATGTPRRDREVGELEIRGTSVTPGYYGRPDATEAAFRDEWLRTGDLGYLVEDELVLCGRIKDVIIVGGRNVFPEDVERAVGRVDGVRPGNVIAFGVHGRQSKESLVVVAETKADDPDQTRRLVHERVRDAVGLPAREVVLVEAGTLPKTSSGKLQRSLSREQYLTKRL